MWDRNGKSLAYRDDADQPNHQFERRVGLWEIQFDADGELFCNQNYGTGRLPWKHGTTDPVERAGVGSSELRQTCQGIFICRRKRTGKGVRRGCADLVESGGKTGANGWRVIWNRRWTCARCRSICGRRAPDRVTGEIQGSQTQPRYIEEQKHVTRCGNWELSGWKYIFWRIEDKSEAETDLPP